LCGFATLEKNANEQLGDARFRERQTNHNIRSQFWLAQFFASDKYHHHHNIRSTIMQMNAIQKRIEEIHSQSLSLFTMTACHHWSTRRKNTTRCHRTAKKSINPMISCPS
jgi:hypothetical protein